MFSLTHRTFSGKTIWSLLAVAALVLTPHASLHAQFGGGGGLGGGGQGGFGGGGQGGFGGGQGGQQGGQVFGGFVSRAVGGVMVDVDGTLLNLEVDKLGKLSELRAKLVLPAAGDLKQPVEFRKVSLRGLEAAMAEHIKNKTDFSQEILFLAGLQRIQYVFVCPEINDIILAGPAEGWKVDKRGNAVGIVSGRPVMRLDDLLVALRTAEAAANGGITCSIDPTSEGLARLQQYLERQRQIGFGGNPQATMSEIEKTLGMQQITVTGIPAESHFAQVLVSADYRMKRLGMNFDKSPVPGLPSYLQLVKGGSANVLPRWWMAPNYKPMLRDPEGLAWELRGAGVKTLSEEDVVAQDGSKKRTGKTNPAAQKWADAMTEKFEELAAAEPIFGELRNVMDLAVISALIVKENLSAKADFHMPLLLNTRDLKTPEFGVPKQTPSKVSHVKKGRDWIISASGGVEINSWFIADKVEQSSEMTSLREQALPRDAKNWWWN